MPPLLPISLLLSLALAGAQALAIDGSAPAVRVERQVAAMGTQLSLEIEAGERATALAASERALLAVEVVEARLSTWRADSELSSLHRTPLGTPLRPSALLSRDLERALYWREQTGGKFTPCARALVEAWGLRSAGRRPSTQQLELALSACAPSAIDFDLPHSIVRRVEGAGIEEGGFGKGIALDEAGAALLRAGVRRAFIDFGGQTLLLGDGPAVYVALADPDQRERGVLQLELRPGSSATSGNSERGITVDGEHLGHILDPRSGEPALDFGSLIVCAANATDADCLSTALYVMGPSAALRFAHARDGLEVVVLERSPQGLRARATNGLRGRLSPLQPSLLIEWYPPNASEVSPQPFDRERNPTK